MFLKRITGTMPIKQFMMGFIKDNRRMVIATAHYCHVVWIFKHV